MLDLKQEEVNFLTETLEYQIENWGIEEYDKVDEAHEWETYYIAFTILKKLEFLKDNNK